MPLKRFQSILQASFLTLFSAYAVGLEKVEKIEITDSHGKWVFDSPPKRVAIINWTLSEQIIELGVTPLAIADLAGFKKIAPQTKIPNNVKDLGSRFTPNLKKLRELSPELIIIGYSQRDLLRPLSNIAPVMYFNNFSRRYDNAKKADERFIVLAKLFEKTDFANNKLNDRNQRINKTTLLLKKQFNENLPQLTIVSIKNDFAWLFLNNSIPYSVANQLGFQSSPIEKKPSKLGTHKTSLEALSTLDGCVVFLNSSFDTDSKTNFDSINVKNPQCKHTLNPANAYGGSLSQLYLAQSIAQAFGAIEKAKD